MPSNLRLLACQIEIPSIRTASARDAHVADLIGNIRVHLSTQPADLVVLPELCTIEYSDDAFKKLDGLAETLDGPSTRAFSALAMEQKTTVVFGMPRRAECGDTIHISQIAIGPDGNVLGVFDKLHTAQFGWSREKEHFTPGVHTFVFECCGIRIAPIICYDIRFPELCRSLTVDHGVQLILHCGAYGRDESFDTWHAFVTTRAVENQIYMLSLNRAGEGFGASRFCRPWIDANHPATAFPETAEAFEYLDVSLTHLNDVRKTYSFLGDRFPDYNALPHRMAK